MKKILIFFLIAGLLNSCYDDFRLDYEHSTVAFSYVTGGSNQPGVLWRSVVKDEGLRLDVGIYLAGILENGEERWADYEIDPTLLTGTSYTLMPDDYYTLSNESKFIIPSGKLIGRVTVSLDSAKFVNDTLAKSPTYAIPFRLTATSEDSILSTQSTQIVVIKYINHYEGFYEQKGIFETFSPDGSKLNASSIDNVLLTTTVLLDTIETNGSMNLIGQDYKMKLTVNSDNSVSFAYSPNLSNDNAPKNLGLDATPTTSSVSTWEDINGINDGYQPTSSEDKGVTAYGNWPNAETWNWVQYDLPSVFYLNKSDVYWWTDLGGILIPYNTYVEYWDVDNEQWRILENPVVNGVSISAQDYGNMDTLVFNGENPTSGVDANKWNITTFDPVLTNKIRLHFIATESQGILEWQIWGVPASSGLEMTQIESITPNGANTYNPETKTFTLNYKVDYTYENYHTNVSTTLKWRNRIRDGVNEWRVE